MPQVSVIIPTYNRAGFIGNAIQSVQDQTFQDWELIVVDDGSTDNTNDIVTSFKDDRVHYIHQPNRRTPAARNTGIRASKGEYLAFLDSDDLFLPSKLNMQVAVLEAFPDLALVASGWIEIDIHQKPLRNQTPWTLHPNLSLTEWLFICPFIVPAVLIRRSSLERVGLFDEHLYYVEDWDLWLRLAYAGTKMCWEPGFVCLRTVHKESKIHNASAMSAGLFHMLEKFFRQPNLPELVKELHEKVIANGHLDSAIRAFGVGDINDGKRHLSAAIQRNPGLITGNPPSILQSIASASLTHIVSDRNKFVDDICQVLPQISQNLARSRRQMLAIIHATEAFDKKANGKKMQARLMAARALAEDPSWVRNRGLLCILLKP